MVKKGNCRKYSYFHVQKIVSWSIWRHFSEHKNFFQGKRGPVLVLCLKGSFLTKKHDLSSWSQQEVYHFLEKVPNSVVFDYKAPVSKSIFSNVQARPQKSLANSVGEVVRHIEVYFGLSIFKKVRGGGGW